VARNARRSSEALNRWALRREGKKFLRWLEIGTARYDEHSGVAHVFLDRLPVGGFNGYLYLSPQGVEPPPPEPEPEPQRTGQQDDAPEG